MANYFRLIQISNFRDRRRAPIILSEAEIDNRALLMKEWSRYQSHVAQEESRKLQRVLAAQRRALRCLAEVSPHHLYKAAISPVGAVSSDLLDQPTKESLHFQASGPFATPPPHDPRGYEAPDGEKSDHTQRFEYEFELDRKFIAEAKRTKFVKIVGKKQVDS